MVIFSSCFTCFDSDSDADSSDSAHLQTCTERQDPPAEVAQILDSAVTTLEPCCPQNLPIYREIEVFMGIVKNQMLAKVPTLTSSLPASSELPIL